MKYLISKDLSNKIIKFFENKKILKKKLKLQKKNFIDLD